jgi:alcohol dehydrogenase YqhD (iron-dependent ADH family)
LVGVSTGLSSYGVGQEAITAICQKLQLQGFIALGEKQDINPATVEKILTLSV